jgi:hypothetical protein
MTIYQNFAEFLLYSVSNSVSKRLINSGPKQQCFNIFQHINDQLNQMPSWYQEISKKHQDLPPVSVLSPTRYYAIYLPLIYL